MENIKLLIESGSDINVKVKGKTILDEIIEMKPSWKSLSLGEDLAFNLSNRAKLYTFLRQLGAGSSVQP